MANPFKTVQRRARSNPNIDQETFDKIKVTREMEEEAWSKLKTKPIPPEESNAKKKTKNQKYCPYCAEYRVFKARNMGGYLSYRRCTGCGISLEDFYVKLWNGLWKDASKKDKTKQ